MRSSRCPATRLSATVAVSCALLLWLKPATAQTEAACGADGYRVVARRWDTVLASPWELRQNCAHPERPAWLAPIRAPSASHHGDVGAPRNSGQVVPLIVSPLLVHAGDEVRLWLQDAMVRIEMRGIAEQSAHSGEHVTVRIARQSGDQALTVEHIAGIVRAAGDVEMER